jgi:hypothetical protein
MKKKKANSPKKTGQPSAPPPNSGITDKPLPRSNSSDKAPPPASAAWQTNDIRKVRLFKGDGEHPEDGFAVQTEMPMPDKNEIWLTIFPASGPGAVFQVLWDGGSRDRRFFISDPECYWRCIEVVDKA